jgi:hypothetical protein
MDPSTDFDELRNNLYVAYASLTLDVTNTQGLTPTLNFIHPYASPSTNFTGSIGGQLTGTQHRNITQNFTIALVYDEVKLKSLERECQEPNAGNGLRGDLGLKPIIAAGLKQTSAGFKIFPLPLPDDKAASDALSQSLIPNFGSVVDFTLVYGVNGGPNWTLTHFTGPGSGGSGLANVTRTIKDSLLIAFARAGTQPPAGIAPHVIKPPVAAQPPHAFMRPAPQLPSGVESAGRAAQDEVTRMILQRLLPPGF